MEKYNSLTFLKLKEPKLRNNGGKRKRADFICDCGNIKEYDYSKVITGETKQCAKCGAKLVGSLKAKHQLLKHPLYAKWSDMKKRCYNSNVDRYKSYGALGITVCDEWKNDFLNFFNWSIENGWKPKLTIERIDVYKNYCPENCKYITAKEQNYNKKNTFYVTISNKQYCLAKLMNFNNIKSKYSSVWHGMKQGKTIEYYIQKLNIQLYELK